MLSKNVYWQSLKSFFSGFTHVLHRVFRSHRSARRPSMAPPTGRRPTIDAGGSKQKNNSVFTPGSEQRDLDQAGTIFIMDPWARRASTASISPTNTHGGHDYFLTVRCDTLDSFRRPSLAV